MGRSQLEDLKNEGFGSCIVLMFMAITRPFDKVRQRLSRARWRQGGEVELAAAHRAQAAAAFARL
jgi:hypothetical protein